jgi:hypothetical protein
VRTTRNSTRFLTTFVRGSILLHEDDSRGLDPGEIGSARSDDHLEVPLGPLDDRRSPLPGLSLRRSRTAGAYDVDLYEVARRLGLRR